jgi:hypothetical protein
VIVLVVAGAAELPANPEVEVEADVPPEFVLELPWEPPRRIEAE